MSREIPGKYGDPSKETRYGFLRDQDYRAIRLRTGDDFQGLSQRFVDFLLANKIPVIFDVFLPATLVPHQASIEMASPFPFEDVTDCWEEQLDKDKGCCIFYRNPQASSAYMLSYETGGIYHWFAGEMQNLPDPRMVSAIQSQGYIPGWTTEKIEFPNIESAGEYFLKECGEKR